MGQELCKKSSPRLVHKVVLQTHEAIPGFFPQNFADHGEKSKTLAVFPPWIREMLDDKSKKVQKRFVALTRMARRQKGRKKLKKILGATKTKSGQKILREKLAWIPKDL